MADSFGDHDTPQEGAGKRPAQTIEGTATEVAVHVPEEAHEAAARHDDAPEDEAAAEDEPKSTAGPGPKDEEAEAKPAPSERKGPPPASTISEMKSFVTHLAAGLLGGLRGV